MGFKKKTRRMRSPWFERTRSPSPFMIRMLVMPFLVGIPAIILFITEFNGTNLHEALQGATESLLSLASLRQFWPVILLTTLIFHWYLSPVVHFFCRCTTSVCSINDADRAISRLNGLHAFVILVSVAGFLLGEIAYSIARGQPVQLDGTRQMILLNAVSKGFLAGVMMAFNLDNLLFPAKKAALAYEPRTRLRKTSIYRRIVIILSSLVLFIVMQLFETSSTFFSLGMKMPGEVFGSLQTTLPEAGQFFNQVIHNSRVDAALKVIAGKMIIYLGIVLEMSFQIKQMLRYPIRTMENRIASLNSGNIRKVAAIDIVTNDEFATLFQEINTLIARQQAELDSSSQRLENLVQTAADPVISFTGEGRILAFNPAAERFFGYSAGEAAEKKVTDLLEFPRGESAPEEPAWETRGLRRLTGIRKGGERAPVEANVSSAVSGSLATYTAVIRDIAAQLELEESLTRAKGAAEKANRLKSEFLANMSHELRTPLNAVLGFTQLLVSDKNLTEGQLEKINIISRSGEHLLSLINDILDISKIEAGKQELHPVVFSPERFVEDIHEMFSLRCKKAGLGLYVEHAGPLPERVAGDLGKLRQVLINLVGNAVKFTSEGGIGITVGPDAGKIRFSVSDTGKGIPPEELELIMQPFAQASTNDNEGGTGLGLAISSRFIQMMGGTLEVESELGSGSTFSFAVELPETEEPLPEERGEAVAVAVKKGTEATALIVDDKELNRLVLKEMLEGAGFLTMEAENGKVAVERTREFKPALVFMDIKMPVMDGYEAVRRIRDYEDISKTPVFALTASAFVNDEQRILASGFDGFLAKPFKKAALFALIRDKSSVSLEYETAETPSAQALPDFDSMDFRALAARLGQETVTALADSLMINDFTAVSALAESLRDMDRDFSALLKYYADGFDEDALQRVIDALGLPGQNHE